MPDEPGGSGPDYDEDFYAWTQYQAKVLRRDPSTTTASTATSRRGDRGFGQEHAGSGGARCVAFWCIC